MSNPNSDSPVQARDENESATRQETEDSVSAATQEWHTPQLEDVSEQVMAQPYIRFT